MMLVTCVLVYMLCLKELARSLKKVENSKEQTSEEIENLREKEDEMEIQLAAIQQSINTVSFSPNQ